MPPVRSIKVQGEFNYLDPSVDRATQQFHTLVQDAIKKKKNRLLEERLVANVVLFLGIIGHLIVRI